jgi:phosphate transport system protein
MRIQSPRETFDRQLQGLLDEVLVLGSMVEQAILGSVDALKRRDMEESRRIYISDRQINIKRYEIEHNCLTVIATQQPMARDLRLLAAILEIITELERIGDYAKGIAHISLMIGKDPLVKPLIDVPRMAEIGADMLHRSLTAFTQRDAQAAREIAQEDDKVDVLYNKVYRDLLDIMIADPKTIDRATVLIWVAHNLERVSDRVTNICERIIFVVTGLIVELDRTDDEMEKIE